MPQRRGPRGRGARHDALACRRLDFRVEVVKVFQLVYLNIWATSAGFCHFRDARCTILIG